MGKLTEVSDLLHIYVLSEQNIITDRPMIAQSKKYLFLLHDYQHPKKTVVDYETPKRHNPI